ncbi:MAG: hypothetical protein EBY21_09690 [Alphaproteobacteria bacterium]|nr:hypothetical protein [Alphaproteobacteria bacterium]
MKTEVKTFDDVVEAIAIERYSQAERTGLLKGDKIVAFGIHNPKEIIHDPGLIETLKSHDYLTIVRGDIVFKLHYGNGLEGAKFEAAKAVENVDVGVETLWPLYWGGTQNSGNTVFIPDHLFWGWALVPPLLYARFHIWMFVTATFLLWAIAAFQGLIVFLIAYLASVALPLIYGAELLREAAQKQGYAARGIYAISSHGQAAALEMLTCAKIKEAKQSGQHQRVSE